MTLFGEEHKQARISNIPITCQEISCKTTSKSKCKSCRGTGLHNGGR